MLIGTLDLDKVEYIMAHLSEQSRKEAEYFGQTVKDVKQTFRDLAGQPFSVVFHDEDGTPCAMASLELKAPKIWKTHFAIVEDGFKRIGLPMTHFIAKFTTDLVERTGGAIEAMSPFDYGVVFDWFESLGFHCEGRDGKGVTYKKRGG